MNWKLWVAVLSVAFLASVGVIGYAFTVRHGPGVAGSTASAEALSEQPHTLATLFPAPAFAYPDHRGALITNASLRGRPYLANFIFTTCRTICPLLTAKMVQVQRALPDASLRFVSFSVDPEHDTPAALAEYAARWNATEARWSLLATDPTTLPLTAAGFHITAAKATAPGALDPVIHSAIFVLVDGEGQVRGAYDSEHREDFEALLRDARVLAGGAADAGAPTAPRDGLTLYHQLSCAGCHERPALAPSLRGLAGTRVELEASNLVTVDRDYLKESILQPDLKRVRGYPLRMPTYAGLLSAAELDGLVDYLLALPAQPTGQTAPTPAETAIDPVCDMEVRVDPDAIHAEHDGRTYYFCADQCRVEFRRNPAAYLKKGK